MTIYSHYSGMNGKQFIERLIDEFNIDAVVATLHKFQTFLTTPDGVHFCQRLGDSITNATTLSNGDKQYVEAMVRTTYIEHTRKVNLQTLSAAAAQVRS